MSPSGHYEHNVGGHYRYAIRYIPGTDLAIRYPRMPRGRFRTREEAENIRAACVNAAYMEVVDVRKTKA